jgi:hypothetical protein
MEINTQGASFLIEGTANNDGCVIIKSTSEIELHRFFGSLSIGHSSNSTHPYFVKSCKQEFANALIIMVKEIDYSQFSPISIWDNSDLY